MKNIMNINGSFGKNSTLNSKYCLHLGVGTILKSFYPISKSFVNLLFNLYNVFLEHNNVIIIIIMFSNFKISIDFSMIFITKKKKICFNVVL